MDQKVDFVDVRFRFHVIPRLNGLLNELFNLPPIFLYLYPIGTMFEVILFHSNSFLMEDRWEKMGAADQVKRTLMSLF